MSTRIMSACWPLRMPPPAKAVLISLADMANDDGFCWPSIDRLCERTCFGRTAVIDAIRWLEERGVVAADRSNGRKTTYMVYPDRFTEAVDNHQNQSATQTGTAGGPVRHTDPTSPPGGLNQSARRTLTVKNHQEPVKPPNPPAGGAPGFDRFVQAWPIDKRTKLLRAAVVFAEVTSGGVAADDLAAAALQQAQAQEWAGQGARRCPSPDRWLRERRWLDGAPGAEGGNVAPLWHGSREGVEAMGERLGLGRWDKAAFDEGRGIAWPVYRERVIRAARQGDGRQAA